MCFHLHEHSDFDPQMSILELWNLQAQHICVRLQGVFDSLSIIYSKVYAPKVKYINLFESIATSESCSNQFFSNSQHLKHLFIRFCVVTKSIS